MSYTVAAGEVKRNYSIGYALPNGAGGGASVRSIAYSGITDLNLHGSNMGATYILGGSSVSTEVYGGSGDDSFKLTAPASALAGAVKIDGGGGRNTLDYSGYSGNVTVDLPLGSATNVAGGIRNIQNVVGSQGNDIVVGNGGNVLTGGTGRNLLIAGSTPSTLVGNSGEDILVGGTTNYDTNVQALDAIMTEWTRTDKP